MTDHQGGPPDHGLDRLPPQAVEVEQAVLGAMMISSHGADRGIELLSEGDFYHAAHGKIFTAIRSIQDRNVAVDQLTLAEELKQRGQLEEAGGVVYLATIAAEVVTAANIDHHAGIVKEKATARHIIEVSAELTARAFEGRDHPKELIDWAETRIGKLSEHSTSRKFVPIEGVLGDTFDQIDRVHKSDSTVTGVTTGYAKLNDLTSGWQPGDLVLLAARPSVGKTALALCLARNAAEENDIAVGVFSLEMACTQIAQRLLCIESGTDLHKMRTGRLRDQDFHQLTNCTGRLAKLPIFIDDTPGLGIQELRAKARQLHRREDIKMLVVDYMQLMSGDNTRNGREQEVASISRGLKNLARDLGIPVLGLSQLSRAVEARPDKRPQLSDLRESGTLEQDSDVVLFIYRPEMYGITGPNKEDLEGVAEIIVGKQRNGPTGDINLQWDKQAARFLEPAPEYRVVQDEEYQDRLGLND